MYEINKEFAFSASHQLHGLREDHPCARLHGHNYTVKVLLRADELDPVGMVLDYAELEPVKQFIDRALDHRHLNDVLLHTELNPTAENLAKYLYDVTRDLLGADADGVDIAVGVSETPKTWAWYTP